MKSYFADGCELWCAEYEIIHDQEEGYVDAKVFGSEQYVKTCVNSAEAMEEVRRRNGG